MQEIVLKFVESSIAGLFAVIGIWIREKLIKSNAPGLKETAKRVSKVEALLAEIQEELGAFRVQEWVVTNGDKTLSGHSIQKLSMFTEINRVGVESIAQSFQFVPATNLSRNIIRLSDSDDGYILTNEWQEYDDLASLHLSYGVKAAMVCKIVNMQNKWVGILFIGFDEERIINEQEIAFVKLKASQIGAIAK